MYCIVINNLDLLFGFLSDIIKRHVMWSLHYFITFFQSFWEFSKTLCWRSCMMWCHCWWINQSLVLGKGFRVSALHPSWLYLGWLVVALSLRPLLGAPPEMMKDLHSISSSHFHKHPPTCLSTKICRDYSIFPHYKWRNVHSYFFM